MVREGPGGADRVLVVRGFWWERVLVVEIGSWGREGSGGGDRSWGREGSGGREGPGADDGLM